jgi:hypothetical protein
VSPTVVRERGFRLCFYASEEPRIHVHTLRERREAKFWLEPRIELAENAGLTRRELAVALELVREHEHEIRRAWQAFFGSR